MHICRFLTIFSFLVVFILSIHAEQDGDYTYSVANDTATITAFTTTGTTANIPDTLGGYPVTTIGSGAFQNRLSLETVVIGNGVTEIGSEAFRGCTNLLNLTFGVGLKTIRYGAFVDCKRLVSVTLPDSLEVLENSNLASYGVFSHCFALESVTFGTGLRTLGANAFYNCQQLAEVVLPSTVTTLGNSAFEGCTALKSARLNEGLLSLGDGVFSGCSSVTNIALPGTLGSIGGGAFANCAALQSLDIPDNVTNLNWSAVNGCTGLRSVEVGDGVTSIGDNAFQNRLSLETVTIGNSVMEIGRFAFDGCTNLQSATFGSGLIKINKAAFRNCSKLTSLTFPNSLEELGTAYYTEGVFYNCNALETVTFGSGLHKIGNAAFYGCSKLVEVVLPDALTSIGDDAFNGCSSLQAADLGGGLQTLGGCAFSGCTSMTNIAMPSTLGTVYGYAFYNCAALTSLNIPDSVTNLSWTAMNGCTGFKSVVIGDGVTTIGDSAFQNRMSLETVVIGNGVTSIENWAFQNCTNLLSVSFGSGLIKINKAAFRNCTRLASLTLPDSLEELSTAYYTEGVFYNCTSLASVTFGSGLRKIGNAAFYGCSKLSEVILPDALTSIGDDAFNGCSSLQAADLGGGLQTLGGGAFSGCTSMTNIAMPSTLGTVYGYAFYNCAALTSLNIPDSVTNLNWTAMNGCTGFKSVVIGDGVTTIGDSAFQNRMSLETVVIGDGVTNIEQWAFQNCTNLLSVSFGNSLLAIQQGAFKNCSRLASVTFPNSLEELGDAGYWSNGIFYNCTSLASVTFGTGLIKIGQYTFNACTNLTELALPDSVVTISAHAFESCTALRSIHLGANTQTLGDYAFWHCFALTHVVMPDTLLSIGAYTFQQCTSLQQIVMPVSITQIGDNAFIDCTALTGVYFKGNAPTVSSSAFSGVSNVTAYYLLGTIGWEPTLANRPTAVWEVSAPVFAPQDGTLITNSLQVAITCTTEGTAIYYTLDGSEPTTNSLFYSVPLVLTDTATVKAKAFRTDMQDSVMATAHYYLWDTTPTFDPPDGRVFTNMLDVTISCEAEGITLRYTTDGSDVMAASEVYSAPIRLNSSATIKARAYVGENAVSEQVQAAYTLQAAASPFLYPASGTIFTNSLTVSLDCEERGASLRYTLDGNEPSETSILYTGAVQVVCTKQVKAKAFAPGFAPSAIASATYTQALEGSLDNTNLIFMTGSAAWFSQDTETYDGVDAARSGAIGDGQDSWVSSEVSGPGELAFRWKVSSEYMQDHLKFYTNGILVAQISGSQSWDKLGFTLGEGMHTLKWAYEKDISAKSGQDCGWLDEVSWYPYSLALPTFDPADGSGFEATLDVTLACADESAVIRYTTDGSEPIESSPAYTQPVEINATTTIRAKAFTANARSLTVGATYTKLLPAATPTFAPADGTTFETSLQVVLACATEGAEIRYTLDGSVPDTNSARYATALTLSETTTIKARAFKSGMASSAVASATYTKLVPAATPAFAPADGTSFETTLAVSLACATSGAEIRYTLDGTAPTTNSTLYATALPLSETTIIKARTFKSGMASSAVASATYTKIAPAGMIRVEPTTLSFGEVAVGRSATNIFSIFNDGETSLTISDIFCPTGFAVSTHAFTISAGSSVKVGIAFAPDSAGTFNGISVISSGATIGSSNVIVSGTGVIAEPVVSQIVMTASAVIGGSGSWPLAAYNAVDLGAQHVVDNQSGSIAEPALGSYWLGRENSQQYIPFENEYFVLDLGREQEICRIELFNTHNQIYNDRGTRDFIIYGAHEKRYIDSASGYTVNSPSQILSGTLSFQPRNSDPIEPAIFTKSSGLSSSGTYRYIMFKAVNTFTPTGFGNFRGTGLNEIRLFTTTSTPTVATPLFSPGNGAIFDTSLTVTLSCATAGATIRYTLDGREPSAVSPVYAAAISISQSTVIKARAFKSDCDDSKTAIAVYSRSGQMTQLSPVPVPHTWLANYQLIADGNYETAALVDIDEDGYKAWEEYVAGTCPTNSISVFLSNIAISNGALHVTWTPDMGTQRKYTIEGKASLGNLEWISPTNADSRFFRIKVDLP